MTQYKSYSTPQKSMQRQLRDAKFPRLTKNIIHQSGIFLSCPGSKRNSDKIKCWGRGRIFFFLFYREEMFHLINMVISTKPEEQKNAIFSSLGAAFLLITWPKKMTKSRRGQFFPHFVSDL